MKEKVERMIKKVVLVHPLLLVLFVILSSSSLFCIFYYSLEKSLISYFCYIFSFYTLSIFVIRVVSVIKRIDIKEEKKRLSDKNKVLERYFSDQKYHFFLLFSVSIPVNILYALIKTIYGVVINSHWIIENGIYYILLTMMRLIVIEGAKRGGKKEIVATRISSFILSLSSVLYLFMVLEMYYNASAPNYPGVIVYAAALYSFVKVGTAIKGYISIRNIKTPAIKVANTIKVSHAFVSLIFLESGMLNIFGSGGKDERTLLLVSGIVVAIFLLFSGVAVCINLKDSTSSISKETRKK